MEIHKRKAKTYEKILQKFVFRLLYITRKVAVEEDGIGTLGAVLPLLTPKPPMRVKSTACEISDKLKPDASDVEALYIPLAQHEDCPMR